MIAMDEGINTFTIQPMTSADLQELAKVHLRAFKGYMNASLGVAYVEKFLDWFVKDSRALALIGKEGSTSVGYVVGATIGYDADLNRELLKRGLWSIITHPLVLVHPQFLKTIKLRFKLLFQTNKGGVSVFKEPEGKGISLVGIAVDPSCGGRGYGAAFMKAFEQHARTAGYSYMRLSVYEENAKARKLYSSSGWDCLNRSANTLYYYKVLKSTE